MRITRYDSDEPEVTISLGYRNDVRFRFTFVDQNGIEHEESFMIRVYGEKPTIFEIRRESQLLFSISEQFSKKVK